MTFVAKLPPSRKSRPRRRTLRSLAFLPTLLTAGNLLCGFAAIHFALRAMYEFGAGPTTDPGPILHISLLERMLPSFLSVGAGLVLLGMVFDAFDGLAARATKSTTAFGREFDSLADIVTCGVAPATLMVTFLTTQLATDAIFPSPLSEHFFGRVTWIAAAIYVAFTAIRLARYNVEHEKAEADYRTFQGLPSPGAAALMVSLILLQDQTGETVRYVIACVMPIVALTTASLMVSRIPYRRFYRTYLVGKQPFKQVVVVLLLLAVFWSYKAPTLCVLVFWYGASGPILWLTRKRDGRRDGTTVMLADSQRQERKRA